MTDRQDGARGRDILDRWCALAEQRLEYLTELFESGRWRRYYSEASFLDNIREAKTAVATWRELAVRQAARDNLPVDMTWLGHSRGTLSGSEPAPGADRPQLRLPEIMAAPPLSDVSLPGESGLNRPDAVFSGPPSDTPEEPGPADQKLKSALAPSLDQPSVPTLDLAAMQRRYPLLRNAVF
jgi:uncharacterized repeat protein (TIGR03809 family)